MPRFPRLSRLETTAFTLYTRRPALDVRFAQGITCMAGANGIGKSTFLATVNYALTGRVPAPWRAYSSVEEYFTKSVGFSDQFFEGRIEEDERPNATVKATIEIDETVAVLERGLFEPQALRSFSVTGNDGSLTVDGVSLSDVDREAAYRAWIVQVTGLGSFEQFVFLQHFILTFDESRNLLLWNDKALEGALFLAFDGDPQQQAKADRARREMEKADSLARNIKYHATRVGRRITELRAILEKTTPASATDRELRAEHNRLLTELDDAKVVRRDAEARQSDALVQVANASATTMALRDEYTRAFAKGIGAGGTAETHPIVVSAIREHECGICGTHDEGVAATVTSRLKKGSCPLCNSPLKAGGNASDLERLKEIDRALAVAKESLAEATKKHERIKGECQRAEAVVVAAMKELGAFENQHQLEDATPEPPPGEEERDPAGEIAQLLREYERLNQDSKKSYAERDAHRVELQGALAQLRRHYAAAEEEFVPRFRELAELFVGMPIEVGVESTAAGGVKLVLTMEHAKRRNQHALSESQRFFVDIALRMALTQQMAAKGCPAGLLIDTPEGSLDIAYERKAGEMFARFAKSGHSILMTANVNTSALLQKMAADCTTSHMTLVRMMEWTELSEVQNEEAEAFDQALAAIQDALNG